MNQRLDTIERLEKILCDALRYSPLIPHSVNVLSIGEAEERETIVNNTNNIVVRYAGSSTNQTKKFPVIYDITMRFEVYFSCQNYLATSAHSFATYLLTAVKSTLSGLTPCVEGLQIEQPFFSSSEDPVGISEETQFLYAQIWELQIQEKLSTVSLDPCVAKGDCRFVFPGKGATTKLPLGGLFDEKDGKIYVPLYTGNNPNPEVADDAGIRWSNEEDQTGDWVFVTDPNTVFLTDPLSSPVFLKPTNNFTSAGYLMVAIRDAGTEETLGEVPYIATDKKLARYALDLWRNVGINGGISPGAIKDQTFVGTFTFGDFAAVKGSFAVLYTDPLNPTAGKVTLEGGSLIGVQMDAFLSYGGKKYYLVPQSPQGRGWIKEDSFTVVEANSIWKVGSF